MVSQKILTKSEVRELIENLEIYYGINCDFLEDYTFYFNESSRKIHITNFKEIPENVSRISGFGLYFGTMHDNNRFRLSIEGSRLIDVKKNYILINNEVLKSYLAGENLLESEIEEINSDKQAPFLIVKCDNQILGCVSHKESTFLTYMPKSRKMCFNKVF